MDQSSKPALYECLANVYLKLKIQSSNRPERTSWVGICRGKNRFVNEVHSELLKKQAIAKVSDPCSVGLEPSSTEETRAGPFRTPPDPVCYTKGITPMSGRKWKSIPVCRAFKGKSLSNATSKLVMRLVRHRDQDERESDGAVDWGTMSPTLLNAFEDKGARVFQTRNGFNTFMKEGTR